MDYKEISKETIGYLYKAHTSIRKSGIDEKIIALVELRISQINGCAYCCGFHSNELRNFGFDQTVIDKVPGWKHTNIFDAKQKSALEWAEKLINKEHNWEETKGQLTTHFTPKEIVELTASISLMNTLNTLRITLAEKE